MIKFLLKGILRDRSRSLLPIIIISIGVMLTIVLSAYIKGVLSDVTDQNAKFDTGHVKVMTKPYAENIDQLPNDLAILDLNDLKEELKTQFADVNWVERIRFGGLLDVPDENGDTKGQGPASGLAIDLLSNSTDEKERFNIENSLKSGVLPSKSGEALLGYIFAEKLGVKVGDEVTFFGTTMNGSMSFQNFTVSGTVKYGAESLDRSSVLIDITDAQKMLDMDDGASELLGYFKGDIYNDDKATKMAAAFNLKYENSADEFAPIMFSLKQQNNLASLIDMAENMTSIFIFIFIIAMSVVLWNTGLLAGLRRYKEFGIRLALGESKGMIYSSLILEAVLIGFIGSIIGTAIGLSFAYYLQVVGINIEGLIPDNGIMLPSVLKARISPFLFFIGFIPGLFAMVLGTMLAGSSIYKRETASLFKELEV